MAQDRRPVQDIAGVAGGGLEEDRDRIEPIERDRGVAHDSGRPARIKEESTPVSDRNDTTRTITKNE